MKENTGAIHAQVPVDVATFLLNEKRSEIYAIEARLKVSVVLIPNIHLETPHYKIVRLRHDDLNQADDMQPSYRMMEMPSEDNEGYKHSPEKAKPVRQEAAVKGITPAQPAPVAAEIKPVAKPTIIQKIMGWFKGFAAEPETPAPVETKPQPQPQPRQPRQEGRQQERRERQPQEKRQQGKPRIEEDQPAGRQRQERGERNERGERGERNERRDAGADSRPPRQPRQPRQQEEDKAAVLSEAMPVAAADDTLDTGEGRNRRRRGNRRDRRGEGRNEEVGENSAVAANETNTAGDNVAAVEAAPAPAREPRQRREREPRQPRQPRETPTAATPEATVTESTQAAEPAVETPPPVAPAAPLAPVAEEKPAQTLPAPDTSPSGPATGEPAVTKPEQDVASVVERLAARVEASPPAPSAQAVEMNIPAPEEVGLQQVATRSETAPVVEAAPVDDGQRRRRNTARREPETVAVQLEQVETIASAATTGSVEETLTTPARPAQRERARSSAGTESGETPLVQIETQPSGQQH